MTSERHRGRLSVEEGTRLRMGAHTGMRKGRRPGRPSPDSRRQTALQVLLPPPHPRRLGKRPVLVGRRQSAGLRTCRRAPFAQPGVHRNGASTGRRFPGLRDLVLEALRGLTAVVPAHRCGAVPDLHRVPFSPASLTSGGTDCVTHYIGDGRRCQYYMLCFFQGGRGAGRWRTEGRNRTGPRFSRLRPVSPA